MPKIQVFISEETDAALRDFSNQVRKSVSSVAAEAIDYAIASGWQPGMTESLADRVAKLEEFMAKLQKKK